MRNKYGIEIKKGYYAFTARSEGRILSVGRGGSNPIVNLENDNVVRADSIQQVLPPMKITRGGVVKANPLTRIKRSKIKTKPSQATGVAPSDRLIKRRQKTAKQKMPGVYANPLVRVTVAANSQRARRTLSAKGRVTVTKAPSRRLMARRRTTDEAPKGFYANPAPRFSFLVFSVARDGIKHELLAGFPSMTLAKQYAQSYADATGKQTAVEKKAL